MRPVRGTIMHSTYRKESDGNFGHPNALDGPRHLQPGFVGFTMVEEQGSFSCALL